MNTIALKEVVTKIGQIVLGWSIIEIRVDVAIATGLGLSQAQSVIILSNMNMSKKLKILEELIDSSTMDDDEKINFSKQRRISMSTRMSEISWLTDYLS